MIGRCKLTTKKSGKLYVLIRAHKIGARISLDDYNSSWICQQILLHF